MDRVRTFVVPAALMFVVFLIVMTTTPQLLNSVIEEKMSRISEVMLGSVDSFELMMGKLIGNVGVALVLAAIYVAGGFATAAYYGYADVVSPAALLALAFFVVVAVVLLRLALHGRRRGVQRAEGRPVADDAGDDPVDAAGLLLDDRS